MPARARSWSRLPGSENGGASAPMPYILDGQTLQQPSTPGTTPLVLDEDLEEENHEKEADPALDSCSQEDVSKAEVGGYSWSAQIGQQLEGGRSLRRLVLEEPAGAEDEAEEEVRDDEAEDMRLLNDQSTCSREGPPPAAESRKSMAHSEQQGLGASFSGVPPASSCSKLPAAGTPDATASLTALLSRQLCCAGGASANAGSPACRCVSCQLWNLAYTASCVCSSSSRSSKLCAKALGQIWQQACAAPDVPFSFPESEKEDDEEDLEDLEDENHEASARSPASAASATGKISPNTALRATRRAMGASEPGARRNPSEPAIGNRERTVYR